MRSSLVLALIATLLPVSIMEAQDRIGRTELQIAPMGPASVTVSTQVDGARLTWITAPGAASYQVHRSTDNVSFAPIASPAPDTTFLDGSLPGGWTAYYRIAAIYPDGRQGMSAVVAYTAPSLVAGGTRTRSTAVQQPASGGSTISLAPVTAAPPPPVVNPTWAKAAPVAGLSGAFDLSWEQPPGATSYVVTGPAIANGRVTISAGAIRVFNVPRGPQSWRVVASFPSGTADSATGAVASVVVRTLPQRGLPFLTRAGTGSVALAFSHMDAACGEALECYNGRELRHDVRFIVDMWGPPNRPYTEVVYGNATDLGMGRRTDCAQGVTSGPNARAVTVCYASIHGVGPGETGFADPGFITSVAAGGNTFSSTYSAYRRDSYYTLDDAKGLDRWEGMRRGASMIVLDAHGAAQFFSFSAGTNQTPSSLGWSWSEFPVPLHTAVLDTEGNKLVPYVCMSCHGGRYNPATHKVDGASLLPLDPNLLSFANTPTGNRASQEDQIRRINAAILVSGSSPAVKNYINELYRGRAIVSGATAVQDFVPSGWSQQQGLYRSVVRPYCTMCHLAAPAQVSFSSWGNFQQNAGLIHSAVCQSRTMPHAELPYREFWLKDTGILYLPGLLAVSLGYPSC